VARVALPRVAPARAAHASVLAWTAAGLLALVLLHGADRLALIQSLIAAIAGLSIVLLTGYVGQISLVQMTLAGVAGFALSRLAGDLGVPFPLALVAAAAAAAPVGVLIGLPALRLRGVQLAIASLAAAVALDKLVFENPAYVSPLGSRIRTLHVLGVDLDIAGARVAEYPRLEFGIVVLAVLSATAYGVAELRRTALGRAMLAVRADERAAAAAAIDVRTVKLVAFAAAAFIAGLAGALIGCAQHVISAQSFGVFVSLQLLAVVYIGGISRVSGAVLAGLLLAPGGLGAVLLDRRLGLGDHQLLIDGLLLMGMVLLCRDGMAGALARVLPRWPWASRRARLVPALEPSSRASP
jgi:branched-chain amino acid transport system permease protein